MKKLLAALVAGALAVSMMSVAAFASDYADDPGYDEPTTENVFEGSASVESTGGWWDQVDIAIADLIGNVDPTTVTKIIFVADSDCKIQYNSTEWDEEAGKAVVKALDLKAGEAVELTDVDLTTTGEDGNLIYWFSLCVSSDQIFTVNATWTTVNAEGEAELEGDAGEDEGGEGEDEGDNPDTGVALAVVPALVAAAAIVASKKRK